MKKVLSVLTLSLLFLNLFSQEFLPKIKGQRLDYSYHIVDWDSIGKIPRFVYYKIYKDSLKTLPRDIFREDKSILTSSKPSDYFGSGFDRGHMLPHASAWNEKMRTESFYMTNIAPQLPKTNRGAWRKIEETERELSDPYCIVISGTDGKIAKMGGKIRIPEGFWKVIYNPEKKIKKAFYIDWRGQGGEIDIEKLEKLVWIRFK